MNVTKRMLINYIVDVLGYGEEEAKEICVVYGSSYLDKKQLKECVKFSQ